LTVYDAKEAIVGEFHGSSDWPGCGERPPLIIDGDTFFVVFNSEDVDAGELEEKGPDSEGRPWGFKLLATAARFHGEEETEEQRKRHNKEQVRIKWQQAITHAAHQKYNSAEVQREVNELRQHSHALGEANENLHAKQQQLLQRLGEYEEQVAALEQERGETIQMQEEQLEEMKRLGIKGKWRGATRVTVRMEAKKTALRSTTDLLREEQNQRVREAASYQEALQQTKEQAAATRFGGVVTAGIRVKRAEEQTAKERAMNQEWRLMSADHDSAEDDLAKFVLARAMGMSEEQQSNLAFELSRTMERLPVFLRNVVALVKATCETTCGTSYDIQPAAKAINNAVTRSKEAYNKAVSTIIRVEGGEDPLDRVRTIPGKCWDQGAQGELMQSEQCKTCTGLLWEAAAAQKRLKADILNSLPGNGATGEYQWETKKEFRVQHANCWFSSLLDPGVKREMRCKQKVEIKYPKLGFRRILDAARLAVVCDTCARMEQAVNRLSEIFEVVKVVNRHANPTALGWSDVQLLVRVRLGGGATHIAELQVQHELLYNARKTVHTHYTTLRESLPLQCSVLPKDLDLVIEATLAAYDFEYKKLQEDVQMKYGQKLARHLQKVKEKEKKKAKEKKATKGTPNKTLNRHKASAGVKSRLHQTTVAYRAGRSSSVTSTPMRLNRRIARTHLESDDNGPGALKPASLSSRLFGT
jgi:predicted small secreted protein